MSWSQDQESSHRKTLLLPNFCSLYPVLVLNGWENAAWGECSLREIAACRDDLL